LVIEDDEKLKVIVEFGDGVVVLELKSFVDLTKK
jgi:hypothetical protein